MNKRQRKKQIKKRNERLQFFTRYNINGGRRNGKTYLANKINRIISNKGYREYKELKKQFERWKTK